MIGEYDGEDEKMMIGEDDEDIGLIIIIRVFLSFCLIKQVF